MDLLEGRELFVQRSDLLLDLLVDIRVLTGKFFFKCGGVRVDVCRIFCVGLSFVYG